MSARLWRVILKDWQDSLARFTLHSVTGRALRLGGQRQAGQGAGIPTTRRFDWLIAFHTLAKFIGSITLDDVNAFWLRKFDNKQLALFGHSVSRFTTFCDPVCSSRVLERLDWSVS